MIRCFSFYLFIIKWIFQVFDTSLCHQQWSLFLLFHTLLFHFDLLIGLLTCLLWLAEWKSEILPNRKWLLILVFGTWSFCFRFLLKWLIPIINAQFPTMFFWCSLMSLTWKSPYLSPSFLKNLIKLEFKIGVLNSL